MLTDAEIKALCVCPVGEALLLKENPPEASMSPQNTIYHHCDVYGGRSSYAACLHFLNAHKEGRGHLRPACADAVRAGNCPAVKMRRREQEAGRALYYVNYGELTERRRLVWAKDDETSVIKFRRKKDNQRFVPTKVETIAEEPKITANPRAPKQEAEIETNIMQKVLEKRLENERNANDNNGDQ